MTVFRGITRERPCSEKPFNARPGKQSNRPETDEKNSNLSPTQLVSAQQLLFAKVRIKNNENINFN